jgi:predicted RNA-binding Zn-ribbon protein involved in translation (DUF1610 family)
MSVYNTLIVPIVCPHCGNDVELRADFRFGLRDQLDYRIGEPVIWEGRGVRTPDRRPAGGNFDGEAYSECPSCGREIWLLIHVRDDLIAGAELDQDRED